MRELGQELRVRIDTRVVVVDAGGAVLRHQDDVGVDLERAQRGRRVGGEERVPSPSGEDDDTPLLEVSDGAAPDVRLGHLLQLERREDARIGASVLQRIL